MSTKLSIFLLLFTASVSSAATTAYCSFETTGTPCATGSPTIDGITLDDSGKIGKSIKICAGCSTLTFGSAILSTVRGTIAFWIKPNAQVTESSFLDTYRGAAAGPNIDFQFDADTHQIKMNYYTPDFNASALYATVSTGDITLGTGTWRQVVVTWQSNLVKMYSNGSLVSTTVMPSPFATSPDITAVRLRVPFGGIDISIDEMQFADWAWNTTDVAASYNSGSGVSSAITPSGAHGLMAAAEWSPGFGQVAYHVDSGTDYLATAVSYVVDVYQGASLITSVTDTTLVSGTAEGLITLPSAPMTTGTWKLTVTAKDSGAGTLATLDSAAYSYTKPDWLGNTSGVQSTVPSPWTNITSTGTGGLTLGTVGRVHSLSGGYGFPQQITSAGTNLLTSPISLTLTQSASALTIANQTLATTSVANNVTSWSGTAHTTNGASGNEVNIAVSGSLEYDGYMPITVTLSKATGNVSLDSIYLKVNVPAAVGKYTFVEADAQRKSQYRVTPTSAGAYYTNVDPDIGLVSYTYQWMNVNLGNDAISLHVQHDDMAGWSVNEGVFWQRTLVEANGSVTYEARIANRAITLSTPMTFRFALMATPTKPLVIGGRLSTAGAYGGSKAPTSSLETLWDFSLPIDTWSAFGLGPTNLATYKARADSGRAGNSMYGKVFTTFTNMHVNVSLPNPPYSDVYPGVCDLESNNDGFQSSPSRCASDLWASNMNRLLNDGTTPNVVDGYYIDEPYIMTAGSSLINGGYRKQTGEHGFGIRWNESRHQLQRVYNLLIAAGKIGMVYVHLTSLMNPILYGHGLMALNNENFSFADSTTFAGLDHFDYLNASGAFVDPTLGSTTVVGKRVWIMNRYSRDGLTTQAWRGISGVGTWYNLRQQQAECILQMADITNQDQELDWWQVKADFGLDASDVALNLFNAQTGITSSNSNVKVTYYKRASTLLAYVANFATTQQTSTITLVPGNLSWSSATSASQKILDTTCDSGGCTGTTNTYSSSGLTLTGGDHFDLTIPRHQCAVFTAAGVASGGGQPSSSSLTSGKATFGGKVATQ